MSKVIQVLEQMGSDAHCQSEYAINNLLVSADLESEITEAICNKDVTSLERQLDVSHDIICAVAPAEDDDEEEKEDDKGDTDSTEETSNRVVGF